MTEIIKQHIVLDLDQTVISALSLQEYSCISNLLVPCDTPKSHLMPECYHIFERPDLQMFLDYIFENFHVSVWTAASKDYALFIIEKILLIDTRANNGCSTKKRKLEWIFFAYHCDLSEANSPSNNCHQTKRLATLKDVFKINEFDLNKTFILDDYNNVWKHQKDNCIIAPPFIIKQKVQDLFLQQLVAFFKTNNNNVVIALDNNNTQSKIDVFNKKNIGEYNLSKTHSD